MQKRAIENIKMLEQVPSEERDITDFFDRNMINYSSCGGKLVEKGFL